MNEQHEPYGYELILDIHECNPAKFTRKNIRNYFKELCVLIDMEREKLCWWDDLYTSEEEKETEPHLVGTSAIQFIRTSNIIIHTLDILKHVYINIFSCKDFDTKKAAQFTQTWFDGKIVNKKTVWRI